jgi:hypothetical protein
MFSHCYCTVSCRLCARSWDVSLFKGWVQISALLVQNWPNRMVQRVVHVLCLYCRLRFVQQRGLTDGEAFCLSPFQCFFFALLSLLWPFLILFLKREIMQLTISFSYVLVLVQLCAFLTDLYKITCKYGIWVHPKNFVLIPAVVIIS